MTVLSVTVPLLASQDILGKILKASVLIFIYILGFDCLSFASYCISVTHVLSAVSTVEIFDEEQQRWVSCLYVLKV